MRKVDIERSRDYYKETLHIAMTTMTEMAKAFEKTETHYRERIKRLEVTQKEK